MIELCRVCGFQQAAPPWGDDGTTPSFEICDCCGVEFGYEDATRESAVRFRQRWLASGAPWFRPGAKPSSWSLEHQLRTIGALP